MEKFVDELETENGDMTAILERLTIMENDATLLDVDTGVINVELPVYRQLVDAFVEDSSIDDAIYVLGEALRLGRLESEIYLKKVRNLSRKQFFLRAIMIKCRERAGLADPVWGNLNTCGSNQNKKIVCFCSSVQSYQPLEEGTVLQLPKEIPQ